MNLFLGRFQPVHAKAHIWDIESDWQMHNHQRYVEHELLALTPWWEAPLAQHRATMRSLADAPQPPSPYEVGGDRQQQQQQQHELNRSALSYLAMDELRPPRVPEEVWAEWYGVSSLSSFDAILSRAYAWPLRHFGELDFDRAHVTPRIAANRLSSSGSSGGSGGGDGTNEPNVLSSQLSGIKKFIPFGRRRPAERRLAGGGKTGQWRAAGDVPPLWRALLGETVSLPPRYHYTLRLYSVALAERADSQLVYACAVTEANGGEFAGGRVVSELAVNHHHHHHQQQQQHARRQAAADTTSSSKSVARPRHSNARNAAPRTNQKSVNAARTARVRSSATFVRTYLSTVDKAPPLAATRLAPRIAKRNQQLVEQLAAANAANNQRHSSLKSLSVRSPQHSSASATATATTSTSSNSTASSSSNNNTTTTNNNNNINTTQPSLLANLTEPRNTDADVRVRGQRRVFVPDAVELTHYTAYVNQFGAGDFLLAPPSTAPAYVRHDNDDGDDEVLLLPAPSLSHKHSVSKTDMSLYIDAAAQGMLD